MSTEAGIPEALSAASGWPATAAPPILGAVDDLRRGRRRDRVVQLGEAGRRRRDQARLTTRDEVTGVQGGRATGRGAREPTSQPRRLPP